NPGSYSGRAWPKECLYIHMRRFLAGIYFLIFSFAYLVRSQPPESRSYTRAIGLICIVLVAFSQLQIGWADIQKKRLAGTPCVETIQAHTVPRTDAKNSRFSLRNSLIGGGLCVYVFTVWKGWSQTRRAFLVVRAMRF